MLKIRTYLQPLPVLKRLKSRCSMVLRMVCSAIFDRIIYGDFPYKNDCHTRKKLYFPRKRLLSIIFCILTHVSLDVNTLIRHSTTMFRRFFGEAQQATAMKISSLAKQFSLRKKTLPIRFPTDLLRLGQQANQDNFRGIENSWQIVLPEPPTDNQLCLAQIV